MRNGSPHLLRSEIMMQRVTLSFDNGPHPEVTPAVLDTLARHGIRTTFFVVGDKLVADRAPSERAHAEGHWIGNHTWSHSSPFRDRGDADFVRDEIDRTQREIGDLSHPHRLFRPYGGQGRLDGALNGIAVDYLRDGGYSCIMWNALPGDFRDRDGWVETALQQVETTDWPLVVLHDVNAAAMRHLDRFIGLLEDRGMIFEQSFPPSCIAMDRGATTAVLMSGIVAG
jgi:peptidoglycan/xylan/chitin deacetylase (PgdA/CDA1 family)